jgi:hypothetical protein
MALCYTSASVISWSEDLFRASIGWLCSVLAVGVLTIVGVKNNPVALVAMFACIASGFVLVVSDLPPIAQSMNHPSESC